MNFQMLSAFSGQPDRKNLNHLVGIITGKVDLKSIMSYN